MDRPPLADELLSVLDGRDLEKKVGETFLLLVAGSDGYPRVAMLSVGELLAVSPSELRIALWRASKTTEALTATGRATLAYYAPRVGVYVELEATRVRESSGLALFRAHPSSVRRDEVEYAEITSGVRYTLRDASAVLTRWERTIAGLRDL